MSTVKIFDISSRQRRRIALKRILDSVLVLATAPVTLPLTLVTAVAVRAKMGSPIFYRQERIGFNENTFSLLKFRSMLPESTKDGEKLSPSKRVTPFGALLRRSSLDELPQLLNVLRGDMSLVGPRPLLVEYLPHYKDFERYRHSVRPGITGVSQVSGRNDLGWDERLELDAEYARDGKISDDFHIIFKTLKGVLKREGTVAEPWTQGEYLSVYRSYPNDGKFGLRRFEPKDIEARVKWLNDPRTRETLTVSGEITVEGTENWLKSARKDPLRRDLAVYDLETLEIVAIAGYKAHTSEDIPIFYFAVDPDMQGRRIGSATLLLLLDFMKSRPELNGAAGEIFKSNIRSIKIHERLGFEMVDAELPENRIRMEIKW